MTKNFHCNADRRPDGRLHQQQQSLPTVENDGDRTAELANDGHMLRRIRAALPVGLGE